MPNFDVFIDVMLKKNIELPVTCDVTAFTVLDASHHYLRHNIGDNIPYLQHK